MRRKMTLAEGALKRIVNESVKRVLREVNYTPWQDMIGTETPNLVPIDCEFNDRFGDRFILCENTDDGSLALCSQKTKTRQRVNARRIDISNPHDFFNSVRYIGMTMLFGIGSKSISDNMFVCLLKSILEFTGDPGLFDECDAFTQWDAWAEELGL